MNEFEKILKALPYEKPFLFVDELISVSNDGIEGKYTFKRDEFFYQGHFKDNPVTPGVILMECMAQIGLVCLGVYLLQQENLTTEPTFALSSSEMDYFLPVLPGETVTVVSEKIYFRFQKLKCKVKMLNRNGETICKGIISGMILKKKNIQ